MKIKELLQGGEQLQKLQSIEADLLKRHTKGSIAGWGAVLSALVQLTVILVDQETFAGLKGFPSFRDLVTKPEFYPTVFVILGILLYLLYRRTSLLFSETREPFRYTFYIKEFVDVAQAADQRFVLKNKDRLNMLHHDLTEFINQRINRFSVLETPASENNGPQLLTDVRKSSHIHIYGNYAIREDKQNDEWIIHVMPYVRVGPEGSPATLAQTVRFPLADDTPDILDTEEYNQLVEKVYSRLTTEIYARIENDIQSKIKLFPTAYLRANALFIEAQDFAASNTINAFECATRLYQAALREIESTFVNFASGFFFKIPIIRSLFVPYIHQYARIQLGYARCLIIRNRTEALSGRKGTPVFEIKHNIKPITGNLERYYSTAYLKSDSSFLKNNRKAFAILTFFSFPPDTWSGKMLMKHSRPEFIETSKILFQAYVLLSLTDTLLGAFISSRKYLDKARAVYPDMASSDTLYLLAEAFLEPNIKKALIFFRQATEKDPASQVAQYFLAYWTEIKYFRSGYARPESARIVLNEYEKVLRINPGNIAALAAQGYIYWLIHDLTNARRRFQEGCNIKSIAGDVFTGHLIYGIARIAMEQGRITEGCELFRQAISLNPNIGTYYSHSEVLSTNSYYDFISPDILERYREYCNKLCFIEKNGFFPAGSIPDKYSDKLIKKTLPEELRKNVLDLLRPYIGTINPETRDKLDRYEYTDQVGEELMRKRKEKAGIDELKAGIIDSFLMLLSNNEISVTMADSDTGWLIKKEGVQDIFLKTSSGNLIVGVKCVAEPGILDMALSYVRNDFGNASLNYYDRFGDNKNYREAVDSYSESITKYPFNYVAKYNKSMALAYNPDNEESAGLLDDVIANNPFWIEALISLTGMIKKGERAGREIITASSGDRDLSLQQERKSRNITENVELLRQALEKTGLTTVTGRLSVLFKEIFKTSKLGFLYESMEFGHFDSQKIEQFLKLDINWHQLDEKDVIALRAYATVYYKRISNDAGSDELYRNLSVSQRLYNHILTHYYPEDFSISLDMLDLLERLKHFSAFKDDENDSTGFLFETRVKSSVIKELEKNQLPGVVRQLLIDNDGSFTEEGLDISGSGGKTGYTVTWKSENDKTGRIKLALKGRKLKGYYSEKDYCSKVRDSYIKYWLEQDHTNYKAFTWVQEYTPKDYISLFIRAFKDQEELNPVLVNMLGEQLMRDNDNERAVKYYSYFIMLSKPRPVYYLNIGKAYLSLGKPDLSLENLEKAVELRKTDKDDVWKLEYYYESLAEAYYRLGCTAEFTAKFEKSGDLNDEPEEKALVYNRIGILFYNDKKGEEAIKYYNEAIRYDGTRPIFHNNSGLAYTLDKKWDEAIACYETAVELRRKYLADSRGLDYYYDFLSEAYYNLGRTDEFISKFENSGDLEPEPDRKALVYNRVGNLFYNDKKFYEAVGFYMKAIGCDTQPVFYSNTGLAYAQLGQWENALAYYNEALLFRKRNPNDRWGIEYYYELLAEAYYRTGRIDEFIRYFESSGDLSNEPSGKATIYNWIGIWFSEDKKEAEARNFYRKAIFYDGKTPIYQLNLGYLYAKSGDWDNAFVHYGKAVDLRRNNPADSRGFGYYYDFLAEAYYRLGKTDEFIKKLETSGDLSSNNSDKALIYNRIGILFYSDLNNEKAITYYNKAISLDNSKAVFQSNLGMVYAALGKWDEAVGSYEKAVDLRMKDPNDTYTPDYYNDLLKEALKKRDEK